MSSNRFELKTLPPELRDLIWSFTLPHHRVFHVSGVSTPDSSDGSNTANAEACFRFCLKHAHPVALRICRESRAVAMREGFFFENKRRAGAWFRPESDILYFDRNQRTTLLAKAGQPKISVPGWDRVLNVGIEWRAFFRDVPRLSAEETIGGYWRAVVESLYTFMPNMRTLNYILPELRHKGGMVWGREPYQAQHYNAVLVPLPEKTQIPWETTRNRGNDRAALLNSFLASASHENRGTTPLMVTWGKVKSDIEKGFEGEDEEEKGDEREYAENYPPEVIGWWLIREGIPDTMLENPQIQRFDY
ncbi:hypothetical protein F53441_12822 [Fusarium austroafricanum]|uniref:2EXR domain-containing protein n=1 Tax=Fusarium austroafricanum TaxID=2364996 RepID=A0A8H4JWQ1_9HYPO|nr:hypothetical protein F53441_12822 [Fusarium austroafricanum]